jgi:feruloyl-CoA synthase
VPGHGAALQTPRQRDNLVLCPNVAACKAIGQADKRRSDRGTPSCTRRSAKLGTYNAAHPGSSQRVAKVLLMTEPPNIDAGEITDKGYLNQRAILARRAALVERLYAERPSEDVVSA